MSQSPFPGPIAPQNNPPINPQYYQPGLFFVSNISNGLTTTVTTSVNHNYVVGQQVRLLIPSFYGSQQLNQQVSYVIGIPENDQVVIPINSTNYNAFIPNPPFGPTPPQIIAVGDVNTGVINASGRSQTGVFIPGSFLDISPA
jgi:hypothetical protein